MSKIFLHIGSPKGQKCMHILELQKFVLNSPRIGYTKIALYSLGSSYFKTTNDPKPYQMALHILVESILY